MRVLIASIAHFCDLQGGSQRVVDEEATELARRGHEVWVIAPADGSRPEHELRHGVHLLRYAPAKVAAWNPARRSAHQRAAATVLQRYLTRVDAIHGHAPLAYLAALNALGSGSPHTCYTIHSPAKMEMAIVWRSAGRMRRILAPAGLAILNRMERECLRRSKAITALSRFTIDCISKLHGAAVAERVLLRPGWADTERFIPIAGREQAKAQLGWPRDVPVLFTLRRLAPRMGLARLIEACGILRDRQLRVHLVVGGSGPMRSELEGQARKAGLAESITFLGRVDDGVLPLAYGACDAFVLPTAELECFGLIALEAISAGRPVLATPVGAIPEIVARFERQWLSRSASATDLAELIERFLRGETPARAPSELHEQVRREFGRSKMLPEFLDAAFGAMAS